MRKSLFVTFLILISGITIVQTLQKGGVLSVHAMTITLDPDVTMNQYLEFLQNKLLPEWNMQLEGAKIYMLKGDRGENENGIDVEIGANFVRVKLVEQEATSRKRRF